MHTLATAKATRDMHAKSDHHKAHDHDAFDPHAWQSLRNATVYVDNMVAALAKADPGNAGAFYRNREAYVANIEALDAEIREIAARLPAGSRTIVTSHDAFPVFRARLRAYLHRAAGAQHRVGGVRTGCPPA